MLKVLKNTRRKALVIMALLAIITTSCLSEIEDVPNAPGEGIVIEGLVVNSEGGSYVRLFELQSNGNIVNQVPITGAVVGVFEGDPSGNPNVIFFPELELSPGFYRPDFNFSGQIGSEYTLSITLPDGTIIQSNAQQMPAGFNIEDLDFEFAEKLNSEGFREFFHDFFVSVKPQEENVFARVASSGIAEAQLQIIPPLPECRDFTCIRPCWSFRSQLTPRDVVLISSATANERPFSFLAASEAFDYHQRYYYEAAVYSLTAEAFQYWSALDQQLNVRGSLLDPRINELPSNLQSSNPEQTLFGFFGASAISIEGFVFNRGTSAGFAKTVPVNNVYDCSERWEGGVNGANFTPIQFR